MSLLRKNQTDYCDKRLLLLIWLYIELYKTSYSYILYIIYYIRCSNSLLETGKKETGPKLDKICLSFFVD